MRTGQKLRELRRQADMTQEELAAKLYVSRDLVSKWENGERRPAYDTVLKIAEIFGTDTGELLPEGERILSELASCLPRGARELPSGVGDALNAFLHTLPERESAVFIRRYYDMSTVTEIADAYLTTQGNVRVILHRTRKKLKKYLTENVK